MRVDVKKYLFVGHYSALSSFFEKMQEQGFIHFIDRLRPNSREIPKEIANILLAVRALKEYAVVDQKQPENPVEDAPIIEAILHSKEKIDLLKAERRALSLELVRMAPLGQFSLEDIAYIEKNSGWRVQFFLAKKNIEIPQSCVQIGAQHGINYFISVAPSAIHEPSLVEMHFDREYQTLEQRLIEVDKEMAVQEELLKQHAKYDQFLHHALARKYDAFHLNSAKDSCLEREEGSLFSIEGWIPVNRLEEVEKSLADEPVHHCEIALEKGETAPTYLENKGLPRIGEDLVQIYDTPSNTDRDPSLWVLFAFALFFAMIVNDAGYGLLFFAGALYFRFKNGEMRKTTKRVWKLSMILFGSCIVWGVMTNSFFGMTLEPDHGFRQFSVLNKLVEWKADYHFSQKDTVYDFWVKEIPSLAKAANAQEFLREAKTGEIGSVDYSMMSSFSDAILMELALLTGIVHITFGFLRYIRRNWGGIGWILAMWGGYFYFPLMLKATTLCQYALAIDRELLGAIGLQMIYIGIAFAVGVGLIRKKLAGLLEVMNAIQVFADVLSYLRLYALGLAGGIVASTLNEIAGSLVFFGAGILLVLGHGINMVLAIVGGVIHGLRLNFIEWYHYSFEGGGKAFRPLRKLEKD